VTTALQANPKFSIRRSVQPAIEPVTLTQAKDHCGVSVTDDDTKLTAFITAAREAVEKYLNRTLITTTWVMRMQELCGEILVPFSPLIAVSSIAYDAADGTPTTLATTEYQYDIYSEPGRIKPAYNKFWPVALYQYNAARITFTAGYGTLASDVPGPIKQGILAMVATLFAQRETIVLDGSVADVPEVARFYLYPYRVWWM